MQGILFDLGQVVGRAKENLEGAGVADRCRVIEGSFFESVPTGADAYLFRHIIHDWTDEPCIQILGRCREVIPRNGKLLIVDCVVPAGNAPSPAKDMDLIMLTYPEAGSARRFNSRPCSKHQALHSSPSPLPQR